MNAATILTAMRPWADVLVPVAGLITAIITVRKYFDERQRALEQQSRDLQWRRIEFLSKAGKELDGDPRAAPFMRFCDSLQSVVDTNLHLDLAGDTPSGMPDEFIESLEFVLKYFSRMRMAVDTKAITIAEARIYTWYFIKILQIEQIRTYCIDHGYSDILILAEKVLLNAIDNSPNFDELPSWESVIRKAAQRKQPSPFGRRNECDTYKNERN